jgi:hypothetical protein
VEDNAGGTVAFKLRSGLWFGRGTMRRQILTFALLLMLCACSTPRRGENITGPMTDISPEATEGRILYMAYCNKCHPQGEGGVGPALNNKPLPGPLIKSQVRLGGGAMPSFSKDFLADEKLDRIIAYLQILRKQ